MNKPQSPIHPIGMIVPSVREKYMAECKMLVGLALDRARENKAQAAKILGINRTTLMMWLKIHMPERIGRPKGDDWMPRGSG